MTRTSSSARLALIAAVTAAVATLVPTQPASAETPTAMASCKAGKLGPAPDVTQTVFMSGTSGHAFYPRGTNPDNALFPGDVVRIEISGTLRYDATHTTGPAGAGEPNANGIRPYAATAQWNNNPHGPVGDAMAAVALRSCTAVTGKAGVRLAYGIRDANLSNNGGGFTITTQVWKAPGRLTIDGTEVTQGIQNAQGQVALIGTKRTFVRVYFHHKDDGSSVMEGVTGTLRVPGLAGIWTPLLNSTTSSLTSGSNKRQLAHSLLFEVPAEATAHGSRELVVTVKPPADRGGGWPIARHIPVDFGPRTALQTIGLRYSYYGVPEAMTAQMIAHHQLGLDAQAGWWQARPASAWEPIRANALNALPLAQLAINDDRPAGVDGSEWGSKSFSCNPGQRTNGWWYCDGYNQAITWAQQYADQHCPHGGCLVVLLQPEQRPFGNSAGTCFCAANGHATAQHNDVINFQDEPHLQNEATEAQRGLTLAHEIGHFFGLQHVGDNVSNPDSHYPYDHGALGPVVGFRYSPGISLVPGLTSNGDVAAYDLMSYGSPRWTSVYSYCKAMHEIPGPNPTCFPGWNQ